MSSGSNTSATMSIGVTLEVASPGELLSRVYENGKLGGLSMKGRCPGALGELVNLTVSVRRPNRQFLVRGRLAWARHKGSKSLQECFGVDFLDEEQGLRDRLLRFARSELSELATRQVSRVPVGIPVRVVINGTTRREEVTDLSTAGAFVKTWRPSAKGQPLELVLRTGLSLLATRIKGRVAWVRSSGANPGMGVEFFDPDGSSTARIARLLGQVHSRSAPSGLTFLSAEAPERTSAWTSRANGSHPA